MSADNLIAIMRVYVGLIMLERVFSPGFFASFWSAGFGTFHIGPYIPLARGFGNLKFYATPEENDQHSANLS
jgi:hypothetical protein